MGEVIRLLSHHHGNNVLGCLTAETQRKEYDVPSHQITSLPFVIPITVILQKWGPLILCFYDSLFLDHDGRLRRWRERQAVRGLYQLGEVWLSCSCDPRHEVNKPLFGIDIGGTLTKCVYFEPSNCLGNVEDVSLETSLWIEDSQNDGIHQVSQTVQCKDRWPERGWFQVRNQDTEDERVHALPEVSNDGRSCCFGEGSWCLGCVGVGEEPEMFSRDV